jgi:hypothetical protein
MVEFYFLKRIKRLRTILEHKINYVNKSIKNVVDAETIDNKNTSNDGNSINENNETNLIQFIRIVDKNGNETNIDLKSFKNIIGISNIEESFFFDKMKRYDLKLDNINVKAINYDKNGNINSMIFDGDDGKTNYNRIIYKYDTNGNIYKIEYYYKSTSLNDKKAEKTFLYDEDGNIKTISYKEF